MHLRAALLTGPIQGKKKGKVVVKETYYEDEDEFGFMAKDIGSEDKVTQGEWIVDSGALSHTCNDKNLLTNLVAIPTRRISMANGQIVEAKESGTVIFTTMVAGTCNQIPVKGVLYVPGMHTNLLSVGGIFNKGDQVEYMEHGKLLTIKKGQEVMLTTFKVNNLYVLNKQP